MSRDCTLVNLRTYCYHTTITTTFWEYPSQMCSVSMNSKRINELYCFAPEKLSLGSSRHVSFCNLVADISLVISEKINN